MLSLQGIDSARLMHAIASVESNNGQNNYPRFEIAYAPKGKIYTVQGHILIGTGTAWNAIVAGRWATWGMASACSWGPWQILFHVAADRGYGGAPWLLWDKNISEPWVDLHLQWLAARGAKTVELLADAWNSGSIGGYIPKEYIAKVVAAYNAAKT